MFDFHVPIFGSGGGSGGDPNWVGQNVAAVPVSTGVDSLAAGDGATAANLTSIAIGKNSSVSGDHGITIGRETSASIGNGLVLGNYGDVNTGGYYGIAIGSAWVGAGPNVSGNYGIAIAPYSVASASNSIAMGFGAKSIADDGIAIGQATEANGISSVSIGDGCITTGLSTIAIGDTAKTFFDKGIAIGLNTKAGYYGISIGETSTTELGSRSICIGDNGSVNVDNGVAIGGYGASVLAAGGVAIGAFSNVTGVSAVYGIALGYRARVDIPRTKVTTAVPISHKSSVLNDAAKSFNRFSTSEVILMTEEFDLDAIGTESITLPAGATFYVDSVGVIVSALDGTVTTEPTIRLGYTGNDIKAAVITTSLTALRKREVTIVETDAATEVGIASTNLEAQVTVVGVKNTATVYKGRAYFKGILVQDQ